MPRRDDGFMTTGAICPEAAEREGIYLELMPFGDYVLDDKPERPCARCRRPFQPTARRRMLCAGCFRNADRG